MNQCLREKKFKKGEFIFMEGDGCERIFVVRSGRVKIFRMASSGREQILEMLGPGETCACNPGAVKWSCSSSAEAATDCDVWFLSREDYVRLVKTNTKLTHALNQLFAERLTRLSCLVQEVSLNDVRKRLVKFLLDMYEDSLIKKPEGDSISVPFTREEIAQRIGSSRETVARYLHGLKREKLIDIKPHQILIRDKQSLEKILFN